MGLTLGELLFLQCEGGVCTENFKDAMTGGTSSSSTQSVALPSIPQAWFLYKSLLELNKTLLSWGNYDVISLK